MAQRDRKGVQGRSVYYSGGQVKKSTLIFDLRHVALIAAAAHNKMHNAVNSSSTESVGLWKRVAAYTSSQVRIIYSALK
eukprot:1122717-Rhodomonas_salina.1